MRIKSNSFECTSNGKTIRGLEFRPAGGTGSSGTGSTGSGTGGLPIMIVSHGFMANWMTTVAYAVQWAMQGFCAYCFDFVGGGFGIRSDGKLKDMTVRTEVEDLKNVILYAKAQPYTDSNELYLMGCSQGGVVSALTAAELGTDAVKKLVLFYPAMCIPDDAWSGKMIFFKFDPDNVPDHVGFGAMTIGGNYIKVAQQMDIFNEIKKYTGPVFIAHGTKDGIVPFEYGRKAYEAYKAAGADAVFMTCPRAPHGWPNFGPTDRDAFFAAKEFVLKDKRLIMDVDVKLTGLEPLKLRGLINDVRVPFVGTSKTDYFEGEIQPGAYDTQKYLGVIPVKMTAVYTLKGKDYTGQACTVDIVNKFNVLKGFAWHPDMKTDSEALKAVNGQLCDALFSLTKYPFHGPRIRVFAKDQ